MTITFNSLAFKDTLVEGGFSDRQAAVLANAIWELVANTLATKDDLVALEQRIDVKLAHLKVELLMWMVSLTVVQTTILGAMLKLLR
ncbi:hypothetical protein H3H37_10965 [Duganella sp. LX20W]|uniref:DUF1640 domain-containing protein n=1 Tax=Rugamonas brunnea TaxID=2758569 RepID=A0A7W2IBR7_9BURK|nr:hypothetical protein [Rugamonas brunnea]MBA5637574.1 hypothetical protein [Rugamonas brunnea]